MIEPYSVYFRIEVLDVLRQLRPRVRANVLHFARTLTDDPFQESDYTEADEAGLGLDVKIVGTLAVIYHVDHADREVRILDVQQVG